MNVSRQKIDIEARVFEEDKPLCLEPIKLAAKDLENLSIKGSRPETPQAYYDVAEKELVSVALDFYKGFPNIEAMLLECTGFQPFA